MRLSKVELRQVSTKINKIQKLKYTYGFAFKISYLRKTTYLRTNLLVQIYS